MASLDLVYPDMRQLLEANTSSHNASSTHKPSVLTPFGSAEIVDDTLLHVLGFIIVLAAAHPLGMLFPRLFKLPLITGYLLVGILTGPFVTNLLTTKTVQLLASSINAMALSFISFQAGQEIYLPELRPQIKGILQLLTVLYLTAMTLLTVVLTFGAAPFFYGGFDSTCKLAIALLFGSIAVLGSPATVMAIKIELNSTGPFTNLMLGATMTAEFVVLVSFSISRVVSSVYCAKLDISVLNLVFTMCVVLGNLVVGVVIGVFIIGIFSIPGSKSSHGHSHGHDLNDEIPVLANEPEEPPSKFRAFFGSLYFKGFLWLLMGYIFYISTSLISSLTIASLGHVWDVKFEPLLVLMVGSCLAGHHAKIRHDMHTILDSAAPLVFLPFFVMTGAALKLDQVANAIPLMSLFVGLRYLAIFLACYGAGRFILKLPPNQYNNLWLTMTPQAGVALGLANEIKELSPDPWAAEFAATIVAAVVVNQIIGPVLCAMGLNRAADTLSSDPGSKKMDGGEKAEGDLEWGQRSRVVNDVGARAVGVIGGSGDLAPIRRAVVIGDDDVAAELALQLTLHGAEVSLPFLDDDKLPRWEAIQDKVLSAFPQGEAAAHHLGDFRNQLHEQLDAGNDPETVVSARSRVAMTEKLTDIILFTGDAKRALDHVKMLHTLGNTTVRKPRLVAILNGSAAQLDPLRNRGVVCVQASMALSNMGMRVALMDETVVAQYVATEASAIAEKPWLESTGPGLDHVDLQRVLSHRRRVLQRNIQTTRHVQQVARPQQYGQYTQQYPLHPAGIAPQRVSMFGRSSVVEFLGTGRGGAPSNFYQANDMYIMGEDRGSMDDDSMFVLSGRSGRGYVTMNMASPAGTAPGSKRGGGLAPALSTAERKFQASRPRPNHRM